MVQQREGCKNFPDSRLPLTFWRVFLRINLENMHFIATNSRATRCCCCIPWSPSFREKHSIKKIIKAGATVKCTSAVNTMLLVQKTFNRHPFPSYLKLYIKHCSSFSEWKCVPLSLVKFSQHANSVFQGSFACSKNVYMGGGEMRGEGELIWIPRSKYVNQLSKNDVEVTWFNNAGVRGF